MLRRLPLATRSLPLLALVLVIAVLFGDRPAIARPQAGSARATPPPAVILRLKETTVFAPAAPNAFGAGTKCDADGNMFLQLAYYDPVRARVDADPGISEVVPESNRIVTYAGSPLSSTDYPNSNLRSFNVTPRGSVYALISTRPDPPKEGPRPPSEYYVERFNDDGTTDSITHIAAPPGATRWLADLIGAFRDGNLVIAGTVSLNSDPEHPSASSWRPFTAIYDPSGRFVREVTLPDDVVNELAEDKGSVEHGINTKAPAPPGGATVPSHVTDPHAAAGTETHASSVQPPAKSRDFFDVSITTGGLVSAPDGNIWILRASDPLRLYAVDPGGEIVKHFQFSPPAPGLRPFHFGFAGPDQIFLKFAHFAGGPTVASGPLDLLGVFNTVSERFETLFALPDTEKGFRVLACSDGRGGFRYLGGTTDNHLAVYDYVP